ncbi:MAG: MarR family winged helix-turn-helix transcriptional regulator [Marinibacterium sp.]
MANVPPIPPLAAMLCYNVYALNLALGRFYQQAFGETGFTYPKFLVLMALAEDGPMSLSDLSAKIGAEANSLSPLVKKMGAFDLLDRVRDPKDERRVLLTLKPFGQKVLEEAGAVVTAGWQALDIPQVDEIRAAEILRDVRRRLDDHPPERVLHIPENPEKPD